MTKIKLDSQKYYKLIYSYLKQCNEGQATYKSLYSNLKGKNIPTNYITNVIFDFLTENDLKNPNLIITIFYTDIKEIALSLKIESNVLRFFSIFRKLGGILPINYIFNIIPFTGYDINYLILLDTHFEVVHNLNLVTIKEIFSGVENNGGLFEDKNIIKFFHYLFNIGRLVDVFRNSIIEYFPKYPPQLQKFLILKFNLFKYYSFDSMTYFFNENNSLDLNVAKLIMKRMEGLRKVSYNINNIVKFYTSTDDKYKTLLFKTDQNFLNWIYKQEILDILDILDMGFLKGELTHKFFESFPNFIKRVIRVGNHNLLVKLKFIKDVPEYIKDRIILPYTEDNVIFDGDDILDMIQNDDSSLYVKYFVEDSLWEYTTEWDYSIDESSVRQYYWGLISDKNIGLIKNKILKDDPEINVEDEDTLQDAAFDDYDIKSTLLIAATEGERVGDESKLYNDCKEVLNELFGEGNWRRSDNYDTIVANISLKNFDPSDIFYGYEYNGEWTVSYIFKYCMKELQYRDKPGLPDYRYGISGDFDKDAFNGSISENI